MRSYFRSLPLASPWAQLLFFGIMTLFLLILSTGAAHLISMLWFGAPLHREALGFLERPEALLENPDMVIPPTYRSILSLTQIISQIGLFLLPPVLFAWIMHDRPVRTYLALNRSVALFPILLVFPLMILILPLISWLTEINRMVPLPHALELAENRAGIIVELFLSDSSMKGLLLNLLMIAVLPAIGEELFFRGVIQQQFIKVFRNPHVAVWVTAILFSFFHFQFHGFLPRMFLGVIFGYLFVWSGSLWLPVLAHLINNAGAVMVEFLAQREVIRTGYEEFGVHQGAGEVIISTLATILIGAAIWNTGSRQHRQSEPVSSGQP
jgi:uncharacterized protein